MNRIAMSILAAGAIVAAAVIFASGRSISLPSWPEPRHLSLVRERLMIPDTAEFREVAAHPTIPNVWCGEVRGKNAIGMLSDWQVFNVIGEDVFLEPAAQMDCR
ncbi:hypothetical protein [Cereibacter sphaeroides]|jgi:hypothetical protein|uniref:hypothetical protein n=1 Tax=Cereibacter sphaeroides TaxID=1063 RepID=UPI0005C19063